ncbi:MAG: hypothetical protein HYV37_01105 [Candidatus Levyibacteriota bacterium]|nr:MAG: hypothetical protein HYV37_01105 [Candidatus Levybacteria bacterium]
MNNNNSGNGFSHGFILGALIGGGIVFLFGTKKGKKLLKTITEEGLEGIAELENLAEDEIEEYENSDDVVQKQPSTKPQENLNEVTSSAKRFFKGIHKKS